jgi:recombination protein RecA
MAKSVVVAGQVPEVVARAGSQPEAVAPPRFAVAELAGRLVELSGDGASAVLTLAMRLVSDAQEAGEPVAWLGSDGQLFYPPDAAESGVDLESLLVVRIPAPLSAAASKRPAPAAGPAPASVMAGARGTEAPLGQRLASAAERLLRSGAFGLVVLDLGKDAVLSQPMQSRLLGLAQHHHAAVLCLTQKAESSASLGSLVSLHAQAVRVWLGKERFACELRVHKDKRRGPVWSEREVYRGPMGLR